MGRRGGISGTAPHNVAACCKQGHRRGACAQVCLSWGAMENKQRLKWHLYYMKKMHLLTTEHLPSGRHRDGEEQLKFSLGSEAPQTAIFLHSSTLMAQVGTQSRHSTGLPMLPQCPPTSWPIPAPGILPSQLSYSAHQNLTVPIQVPVVLPR